jgi:hypothetical protein
MERYESWINRAKSSYGMAKMTSNVEKTINENKEKKIE